MSRDFDGVDDRVEISDIALYEFTTAESFTFCLWVKHDSLTSPSVQRYVTKWEGATSRYAFRKEGAHKIQYTDGLATFPTGTTVLAVDTWYFIALVRDTGADQVRLYLATASGDVVQEASATDLATGDTGANTSNLMFGRQQGVGEEFNGKMANIMFFTRILTVGELRAAKQGQILSGIQGYWPLWGVASPEPDLSGNGNHSTSITGAPRADHPPVGTYAPYVPGAA